jgi:hypothetical protein
MVLAWQANNDLKNHVCGSQGNTTVVVFFCRVLGRVILGNSCSFLTWMCQSLMGTGTRDPETVRAELLRRPCSTERGKLDFKALQHGLMNGNVRAIVHWIRPRIHRKILWIRSSRCSSGILLI